MKTPLHQKIEASILRYPTRGNAAIAKNHRGANASIVEEVRLSMGLPPASQVEGGVSLAGMRVLSRRPVDSAAKFIKRLPEGRGFDPQDLAKEWGMSEETIRKHARDLGCLKYVEVSEDEWVPLVMNPETSKKYTI